MSAEPPEPSGTGSGDPDQSAEHVAADEQPRVQLTAEVATTDAHPLAGTLPSRRFLLLGGASALLSGSAFAWLRSGHGLGGRDTASAPISAAVPGVEVFAAHERPTVRPVAGRLLGGGTYDSADAPRASAVVYNVWASWCAPCRKEAGELTRAAATLRPSRVRFMGINLRDNIASATAFERRYDVPYPSISSADAGDALLSFGRALPPNAIPMTLVVDGVSRLGARIIGPTTFTTLQDTVKSVLRP